MASELELMFLRWKNFKAGYRLAALVPFGIPVWEYELKVQVFAQTQYPLTREFVLRCANAGLDTVNEISDFLGLNPVMVADAVVEEMSAGQIIYSTDGKLILTDRGLETLDAMHFGKLDIILLTVQVDELTNATTSYSPVGQISDFPTLSNNLIKSPDEVKAPPGKRAKRPTGGFFDIHTLNSLHKFDSKKIVEVKGLTTRRAIRKFKPAWLLAYMDAADEVVLELVVDGSISDTHHLPINADGFLEAIDLVVEPPEDAPSVIEALRDLDLLTSPSANKIVEIAREIPVVDEVVNSQNDDEPLRASPALLNFSREGVGKFLNQNDKPAMISVFEHGVILNEAIKYAQERLLIISPWIRSAVVNRQFVDSISTLLRRGVEVTIAYGYEGGMGNDDWSIEQLSKLVKSGLKFLRHENTHAKILLVDNCAVMTSFNWLSFKGDPSRTYRMEEGMQCRSKEFSDQMYEALQSKLEYEAKPACD